MEFIEDNGICERAKEDLSGSASLNMPGAFSEDS